MSQGHTVTTAPSDEHVEISVDGVVIASSDRPVRLEETGLPTRYYLPRDDVRMELLRPTTFSTHCPFKGDASYLTLDLNGQTYDGIVWSYEDSIPNAAAITGLLCFYPDRVEMTVEPSPAAV
jgi:uncharacterized protein (DUF427 family)